MAGAEWDDSPSLRAMLARPAGNNVGFRYFTSIAATGSAADARADDECGARSLGAGGRAAQRRKVGAASPAGVQRRRILLGK